jgi:hypothetical protein
MAVIKQTVQVLFVLDCGAREAEVLRTVPFLSDPGTMEVKGLFIEDEDLLGAARLPGVTEISITNLETKELDPARIAHDLTRQAQHAQNIFEASARKLKLRHSFEVSRGRTGEALVKAAMTSDVVVICRPLRASGLRARRGAEFAALIAEHARILFVNEPWSTGTSIVAVNVDEAPSSREALQRAHTIASNESLDLVLATLPNAPTADSAWPVDQTVELAQATEETLIELCQRCDARLLVVPPIDGVDWQKLLVGLLDKLSCSLLLIRASSHEGALSQRE